MIWLQVSIQGFAGRACTLFAGYDENAGILSIGVATGFRRERRKDCSVITNIAGIERDTLFRQAELDDAIDAYYTLSRGMANDGQSERLAFSSRAGSANPESCIDRDAIEASGFKYRISGDITNDQVACLAACLYAVRSSAVSMAVAAAEEFAELICGGEIVTI